MVEAQSPMSAPIPFDAQVMGAHDETHPSNQIKKMLCFRPGAEKNGIRTEFEVEGLTQLDRDGPQTV